MRKIFIKITEADRRIHYDLHMQHLRDCGTKIEIEIKVFNKRNTEKNYDQIIIL